MNKFTSVILMGLMMTAGLAQANSNRYHPNHLFIKMKGGEKLVNSGLIKSSKKIIDGLYLVKTTDADKLAASLAGVESIEYVQKDFYAGKQVMPKLEVLDPIQEEMLKNFDAFRNFNDPEVGQLWAFAAKNGMDVTGAYASLPHSNPAEVIVAVADTGVDYNHEDLKDVMWENKAEIPGNKIDDDKNGYVDDVHGINTLVRDSRGQATTNVMASHWHGTHVAGTIAAEQNNGRGITGVANNVKIMALRVVPDDADELDSNIVEAFQYAAKMGAKVINCSFGKKNNEGGMVVRDVITEIGKKYGVLVVASAGNDSMGPMSWSNNDTTPKYPASFDSSNLLVVASTTSSGGLSSFSNIGKLTVDVGAPGSNIYSTINGNKYSMASGTSMAAPNTSGVAAMVLSYYPQLKAEGVKEAIMNSVSKVPDFSGKMATGGRVNLKNALIRARFTRRR